MTKEQLERRKAIVEAVTAADYGTVFEHTELLRMAQIGTTDCSAYRSLMSAVKREAEKAGKALASVPGTGYRVMTPGEYSEAAANQARLGLNRFKKGVGLLQHAPVDKMTEEEKRDYNDVSGGFNGVISAVSSKTAEIEVSSRRALLAARIHA